MKKSFAMAFIIALAASCFDEANASIGSTGWDIFLKPGSTKPKPVTAVASVRGDLSGIFHNPSILGTITQREYFAMTEAGLSNDSFYGLLYGAPLKFGQGAGICAGAVYFDAGRDTLYWMEGGSEMSGEISLQKDFLAILSYGQKLAQSLYFGMSYKYATSEIAEAGSAAAQAVDFGIFVMPSEQLVISVAVQNFGKSSEFIETAESLPASVWGGVAYSMGSLNMGFDVPYIMNEDRFVPDIAMEYSVAGLSVSFGYRGSFEKAPDGSFRFNEVDSAVHAGVGLKTQKFEVGYAIMPSSYFNTVHRISIGFFPMF